MTPDRWRQVTEIFHAALGETEVHRPAFLADACAMDGELRREVESMLEAHREAAGFGEGPLTQTAPRLAPGASIGPYRIDQWLGAGGMGQVYRAVDTRLGRSVALKILAPEFADLAAFRARFEQEARTISQLEHEHICSLYDVGFEGCPFLVMPCLEGETLGQRLERGPLPIVDAVTVALQVADALDAAHQAGIVHHDLKPANVFLTKSGVKLLDFGLAAMTRPVAIRGSEGTPPQPAVASAWMVLGTMPYMTPEQLRGRRTDARSDIFALGAVLHEAVTGRKAFDGDDQASVIASIMTASPPPMSCLRRGVPAALQRIVDVCLAKNPDDRWQSARDLERILRLPMPLAEDVSPPRYAWRTWKVALGVVATAVTVAVYLKGPRPPVSADTGARVVQFEIAPPEGAAFALSPAFMAVAPNGDAIAWHGPNGEGRSGLWLRRLSATSARMIPGAEGGVQPFWSPDSRSLAFMAGGKLKRITIDGGIAQTLADMGTSQSGAWSRDDVILYRKTSGALHRVAATGGPTSPVTTLSGQRGELEHFWPQFLPNERQFLFQAKSTIDAYDGMVYVGSLDSPNRVELFRADSHVVYLPTGHLVFMQSNKLMAQSFDVDSLRTLGEPIPVAEHVDLNADTRRGAFSASPAGVLAYRQVGETQMAWFDRNGHQIEAIGPLGRYRNPALAPDERRVAVARIDLETGAPDIWLIELARNVASRLTTNPGLDDMPVWSPDGSRVAYKSTRDGRWGLYARAINGQGPERPMLTALGPGATPLDWSGAGEVVYAADDGTARFSLDLWRMKADGGHEPAALLRSRANERQAQLSADGRWIAYVSNETGRNQVHVRRLASGEPSHQLSVDGGVEPRWRGDSKEIFFLAPDGGLMATAVELGTHIRTDLPRRLFQTSMIGALSSYKRNQYVSTANGQRFLIDHLSHGSPSPITVVVNWDAVLSGPRD